MALDRECFRNCVRRRLSVRNWVIFGVFAVAVFLLALFSWGLALPAAIAWAAGAYAVSVAGAIAACYFGCNR